MKLYRVVVTLEVDANDEDHACRVAEQECSQSSFMWCNTAYETSDEQDNPKE